ncbi:phosphate ABC transporter substrate-binding protein [Dehalobacterium formicoaceticum]|uniref:Phosphate-binding protein n=1 Tax=Dehalobacterium formicoaceticum TaxID=51515 RepID=A0ABT1XZR7_9FIRM|nr:phosphate ABC transporter substrate-binding protein [Dehalobacterium formicoaceticum]MCR6544113.1 phosphate ABC transporter substrate-binding protein [Dehalobacterium formicoaceticum]
MFSRSKIKTGLISVFLVTMLALTGCGNGDQGKEQQPDGQGEQTGALSGSLQLAGSTSVQPLAEELAAAFMEKNPDVKIDVQGGGSSAGVKAAADGVADLGMASRELKDEEKTSVQATVIAKDGIAVVVNTGNAVSDLTMDQVKGIFSGEISNWDQVGGASAPIVVINREEGSGTRGAFEELVLGEEVKFIESAAIQNSTGAVRTAVSSDANAIGYISMGSLDDSVKALKVDGVDATEDNVIAGTYKISRPFNFLSKGEPTELAKTFIDWILSAEGQEVVAEEFIPVK